MKNLGEKIDSLLDLREQKLKLNDQVKEIGSKYEKLALEIIANMEHEEILGAKGEKASASITIGFYPSVKDVETFTKWVVDNNRWEMLQKRVAAAPVKEMLDQENMLPPGVESHTKPKLNLRRS